RTFTRPGPGMPYGAPQTASASADISASMNVAGIERSRSGDADDSWSCRKRAGSILLGAVTVVSPSEALWEVFQRITRGGRLMRLRHAHHRARSTHHLAGRNFQPGMVRDYRTVASSNRRWSIDASVSMSSASVRDVA